MQWTETLVQLHQGEQLGGLSVLDKAYRDSHSKSIGKNSTYKFVIIYMYVTTYITFYTFMNVLKAQNCVRIQYTCSYNACKEFHIIIRHMYVSTQIKAVGDNRSIVHSLLYKE